MKKVILFFLGLFLFSFSTLLGFVIFNLEKEVTIKVDNQEIQGHFVNKVELEKASREFSKFLVPPSPLPSSSQDDKTLVSLPPSHKWKRMDIPFLTVFVANLAKIPMVQVQYSLRILPRQKGALEVNILRKGELAELPKFGWETKLFLTSLSPAPIGYKTFHDFGFRLFVFRKGFPKVHKFSAKFRLFSNGDLQILQK